MRRVVVPHCGHRIPARAEASASPIVWSGAIVIRSILSVLVTSRHCDYASAARCRPLHARAATAARATVAADPRTQWTPLTVTHWYGRGERTVEAVSGTAVWYHTGRPPVPLRWVLIRDSQEQFAPQALLCTALTIVPAQIVAWFGLRWQLEVTFEEARRHLSVETQRQWSDLAIQRITPALLGLFSFVTLLAHPQIVTANHVRQAAW